MRDQTRHAYDTVAQDYASAFRATEPEQALDLAVIEHVVRLLGAAPDVLDTGCGTGRMARFLADRGCRVRGVDLSPGMLAMARRDHPDIPVVEGSLTALPYADASFDGALAWYSTIHLADDELPRALGELRRVLRPGGLLLLGFQSGDGTRDVSEAYRSRGHDVTLLRHNRTAGAMVELAAAYGFAEEARVVRAAAGFETEPQAFVVVRAVRREDD